MSRTSSLPAGAVGKAKAIESPSFERHGLSDEQLRYAASDVLHLHALKAKLDEMLAREGRSGLAQACFDFLPTRALLDLGGWAEEDVFAH
jgi:ribonuclease D